MDSLKFVASAFLILPAVIAAVIQYIYYGRKKIIPRKNTIIICNFGICWVFAALFFILWYFLTQ